MKKINLLIAVSTLLMFVSCQNATNPTNNGNKNNSKNNTQEEVFDINKVTFTIADDRFLGYADANLKTEFPNLYKHVNTITVGNEHYITLLVDDGVSLLLCYNSKPIYYPTITYANKISADEYFNNSADYPTLESFKKFSYTTYEISGNKIYVELFNPIKLTSLKKYYCEQEDGHFLTLSDGSKKVYYDLDLSDNETCRYKWTYKAYKRSNTSLKNIMLDNYMPYHYFSNVYENNDGKLIVENLYYDTDFIKNKLKDLDLLYSNDGYILKDEYYYYAIGNLTNGLKLKYHKGSSSSYFYFDYKLDNFLIFNENIDNNDDDILFMDDFTVYERPDPNNWSIEYEKDKVDTRLHVNTYTIRLSPFENKVITLFDLGFIL